MKRLPKVLKYEEVLLLFEKVKSIRNKILLKTIFYCGLRASESINLRTRDINIKERELKVVQGRKKR